MRHAPGLWLACVCCLALACSRGEDSAEPASEEPAGSTPSVYAGHDYVCPDGKTFNARIDRGNALVTVDGKTLTLAPDQDSFDARYEGEGILFIAKGAEAVLAREGSPMQTCKAN